MTNASALLDDEIESIVRELLRYRHGTPAVVRDDPETAADHVRMLEAELIALIDFKRDFNNVGQHSGSAAAE